MKLFRKILPLIASVIPALFVGDVEGGCSFYRSSCYIRPDG